MRSHARNAGFEPLLECACCRQVEDEIEAGGEGERLDLDLSPVQTPYGPRLLCAQCRTTRAWFYPNLDQMTVEELRLWLSLVREQYGRSPAEALGAQIDVLRFELQLRGEKVQA